MSKEMVNHPKHYNNHPSGVECIDVIRSMCFNIGNAFKYVYRRDDKENFVQDLKKAIFYINDEIEKRKKWKYTIMAKVLQPLFYLGRQDLYTSYVNRAELINDICRWEDNFDVSHIYLLLHNADIEFMETSYLYEAREIINHLLEQSNQNS